MTSRVVKWSLSGQVVNEWSQVVKVPSILTEGKVFKKAFVAIFYGFREKTTYFPFGYNERHLRI